MADVTVLKSINMTGTDRSIFEMEDGDTLSVTRGGTSLISISALSFYSSCKYI